MKALVSRALEKLTEGEAQQVVSTIADENDFEAWRPLLLRLEPELEVLKNAFLLEPQNIPAATTIEENKVKIVELEGRIRRAEKTHRA